MDIQHLELQSQIAANLKGIAAKVRAAKDLANPEHEAALDAIAKDLVEVANKLISGEAGVDEDGKLKPFGAAAKAAESLASQADNPPK